MQCSIINDASCLLHVQFRHGLTVSHSFARPNRCAKVRLTHHVFCACGECCLFAGNRVIFTPPVLPSFSAHARTFIVIGRKSFNCMSCKFCLDIFRGVRFSTDLCVNVFSYFYLYFPLFIDFFLYFSLHSITDHCYISD